MFYTIYKVTNKLDGKIYIGKHQTKNLDDGYMGSGKLITRAIKKYGIENFTKEILFVFETEAEMNTKEAELVTEDFVKEDTNYNLCLGGLGGFGYLNDSSYEHIERTRKGRISANKVIKEKYGVDNISQTTENREMQSIRSKQMWKDGKFAHINHATFTGKQHSDKIKRLIGDKNSIRQSGTGNSHYGKMWIYSDSLKQSMRINKDDPIPNGWVKGRKMKFE